MYIPYGIMLCGYFFYNVSHRNIPFHAMKSHFKRCSLLQIENWYNYSLMYLAPMFILYWTLPQHAMSSHSVPFHLNQKYNYSDDIKQKPSIYVT